MLAVGPNGAGKTNLLEALHVGTQGFSPRTRTDRQLVRFGADAARVEVRGERAGAPVDVAVTLTVGAAKHATLNGAPLRTVEQLRGELATLVFTPDRLGVVKGAPAARRAYFDFAIVNPPPKTVASAPVLHPTGLWWNPKQNGTGLALVRHGDTVVGTLYIYDQEGNPMWLVMPGGAWDASSTIYSGALYKTNGSPFYAYDAARFAAGRTGTLKVTFQDEDHVRIDYTIGGTSGFKLFERQVFDDRPAYQPDRSDLWWAGAAQNGWGITIVQQGATLFLVWYTYDAAGIPTWYAMPGGAWTDSETYEGRVYRTHGSPWAGTTYDPSALEVSDVGTYRIQFSGDTASFSYDVEGKTGAVQLVREPF